MKLKCKFIMLISLAVMSFCFSFICHEELNTKTNTPYKIISHRKDINLNNKDGYDFFLTCKDEMGLYEIDVSKDTYYNKHDGDVIKFDGGFNVCELYRYALNSSTKQNILSSIKDEKIKYYLKNELGGIEILFGIVFSVVFIISFMYDKGVFDN